jgi:thiol-disulfide isomerase/thioredoxin
MSTKALIGILLAGTAGVVIFLFVHLSGDSGKIEIGSKHASAACTRGQGNCLPEVKYIDTTGKAYTPETLAGKVVVINFWATWCHPCQKEIPALSKVYDQLKSKGVVMLGVVTDTPAPSDNDLLNFQSDNVMSYPIVRVSSDILTAFQYPQALPTTFVFDKGGHQVGAPHLGPVNADQLAQQLSELLAQK